MILEDYTSELIDIPSKTNVVVDLLSWLDKDNGSQPSNSNNKLFLLTKALITNDIQNLGKEKILLCS